MPVKKTTTKKADEKKTTAKKTTTKKATTKKTTTTKKPTAKKVTTPNVVVKEKTLSNSNGSTCTAPQNCKLMSILVPLLLIVNTILLVLLFSQRTTIIVDALNQFEAEKVGGVENAAIMKQIYNLDSYKNDQKRRLQATYDALKKLDETGGQLPLVTPTDTEQK